MEASKPMFGAYRESGPGLVYSMVEVQYRDGQVETFPPDYHFASDLVDARVLWVVDAGGPVYRRLLRDVAAIQLREIGAC